MKKPPGGGTRRLPCVGSRVGGLGNDRRASLNFLNLLGVSRRELTRRLPCAGDRVGGLGQRSPRQLKLHHFGSGPLTFLHLKFFGVSRRGLTRRLPCAGDRVGGLGSTIATLSRNLYRSSSPRIGCIEARDGAPNPCSPGPDSPRPRSMPRPSVRRTRGPKPSRIIG